MIAFSLTILAQDWVAKKIVAISDYVLLGQQARIAGDVVIKCFLDSAGSVVSAEVVSGHKILREQARRNSLLWKFQRTATQQAGSFVLLKYQYQYRLEGEPHCEAENLGILAFGYSSEEAVYCFLQDFSVMCDAIAQAPDDPLTAGALEVRRAFQRIVK